MKNHQLKNMMSYLCTIAPLHETCYFLNTTKVEFDWESCYDVGTLRASIHSSMQKRPVPDNRSFLHNGQNLAANLCTGVLYRNGYFLAHVKIGCARAPLLFICDQYQREKTYKRSRGVSICLLLLLCFILSSLYLFVIQSPIPFFNITNFLKCFI